MNLEETPATRTWSGLLLFLLLLEQASGNLVVNPTFINGLFDPEGWAMNRTAANQVAWVCDRVNAERCAVRLVGTGADWAGATSRAVAVQPGETLTVAAWVRTSGASAAADCLYVRFYGGGAFRGQFGPGVPAQVDEWTLCSGVVTVPAGAETADLSLQVRSKGTVLLGAAGLFRGDLRATVPLPKPEPMTPVAVATPHGLPADANRNGLSDALEAYLDVPSGVVSARRTRRNTTCLQTPTGYQSDNDLKVDTILVVNESQEALRGWQLMGYRTPFMAGFRAGEDYVDRHPGSAQTDASGHPLDCGPGSYYMVPTAERRAVMRELFRQAGANGAEAAAPEEPEYIGSGGYSPAFKAEFRTHYGRAWVDPASTPQARIDCQRLMGQLEVALLRACYEGARAGNSNSAAWLLCHSPVNYAAWGIMFPHFEAVSSLGVSDMIAQVWTGTAQSAVNHMGIRKSRTFENALLEYSSSLNLVRGLGIRTWLLMDPLEDAPGRPMAEYIYHYKRTLGAALMFPQTDLYEVMPWPTRIFGSVPPAFATTICTVVNALSDMQRQDAAKMDHGTEGIATFISDSAMWQRQTPNASDFDSFYGLALPLLMKGIPVEIAHLDRCGEPDYLKPYKVLLLSFDAMKPVRKQDVDGLAAWTKAGGRLLVFGGDDAYNQVDLWWKHEGCASPHEYLLRALGLTGENAVQAAVIDRTTGPVAYSVAARTPYAGHNLENRGIVTIDLARATAGTGAAYVKFEDTLPADGWGPWIGSLRLIGTREGKRIDETVKPGSPAEAAFIAEDTGSGLAGDARFVDGHNTLIYRFEFDRGTAAEVRIELGNQYQVSVAPAPAGARTAFRMVAGSNLGGRIDLTGAKGAGKFLAYEGRGIRPAVTGEQGAVIGEAAVARGSVVLCGLPPAHFAKSPAADALLRALVRYTCEQPGGVAYREQGHVGIRRGAYLVVKTFDETARIEEAAVDLLSADLAVRPPGPIGPDDLVILKRLPPADSRVPVIAACSDCVEWQASAGSDLRMIVSNASGVEGALRVVTGGKTITAEARDAWNRPQPIRVLAQGGTALLRYHAQPLGLGIRVTAK